MNQVTDLTAKEYARQRDTLNLVASDNYASPKTLGLLGSVWATKYAEGYPGKRYYAGQVYIDELESFVQQKALELFDPTGAYSVNVQLLSGSPANAMVYLAMLEAGDRILSLSLANGGHLSHLHATSNYKKFFRHDTYDLKEVAAGTFEIDMDGFREKLKSFQPQLVIIGFSSYPRAYRFEEMCKLAHGAGALVLADVSHISGLIATGLHDSPFKTGEGGADFVMTTTHKTFRGPRGATLFARQEYMDIINRTVFPGTSGGAHMHQVAAYGQALLEILGEDTYPDGVDFKTYIRRVLATCKALEQSLAKEGLEVVSPTQNHLCLIKLPEKMDSLTVQRRLEAAGITINRNMTPFDTKPAFRPSGLRLGTPALTSRGLTVVQAEELGRMMAAVIFERPGAGKVAARVKELAAELNWFYPQP